MLVTTKMLQGYKGIIAKENGIPSHNDNYNKEKYNISKDEFKKISKVVWDFSGFDRKIPSLKYINENISKE